MLENILNNVNASDPSKNITKSKSPLGKNPLNSKDTDDTEKEAKTDFKDILNKNIQQLDSKSSKNDKDILSTSSQKQLEKNKPSNNISSPETYSSLENITHKDSPKDLKDPKNNFNQKIDSNTFTKDTHRLNTASKDIQDEKKLSDVKTLGEQKNLAPKNIALESDKNTKSTQNSQNNKISQNTQASQDSKTSHDDKISTQVSKDIKTPQAQNTKTSEDSKISQDNKTSQETKNSQSPKTSQNTQASEDVTHKLAPKTLPTQSLMEQKLKNSNPDKNSAQKSSDEKPLATILKTLNEVDKKELEARKKFNNKHKIEYKTEGKTEKIAVIERGVHLPKNIVEPKIENAQKEEKLLKEQEKLSKTPQPLKEAISQTLIKEIKPKTDTKKSEDTTKDLSSQKKTKKSGEIKSNETKSSEIKSDNTTQSLSQNPNNPKLEQKENSQMLSNQDLMQENNTQELKSEKTKKKQNTQEAKKDKEKTDNISTKDKDSSATLGAGALKNDLSYKSAIAKETIKNFAQNFQEEIKKFKPPMTKISLELHPEKLGKLELTIKQSGKNLQVSVVSNHQAIALFVQNQAELKQNLAMIGFSGVDLSFSSQNEDTSKNNQDSNQQKRNKNGLKKYDEIKNVAEIPYDTMDLILPKYA